MSADRELRIDSATGVEVALPVVGAGGRAYAFVIDWHIRVALAIAWYGSSALLHSWLAGGTARLNIPFDPGPSWFLGVMLPTAGLYFLYHPVLEIVLRGRTPGKRFAGLRIATRDGGTPGIGALLIRNVFRLVDSFPALYCVGLVATLVTRQHVRLGDLAAGTLLIYERERALPLQTIAGRQRDAATAAGSASWVVQPTARPHPTTMARAELLEEFLARWDRLTAPARTALARELLQRLGEPASEIGELDEAGLRRRFETRLAAMEPPQ
ncbi:MAG: RDD family protein [Steroidobacteraceae bacterium]|nr:RDD family protein [Nevskiaceae bacterium]